MCAETIELETYGIYNEEKDENAVLIFTVPRQWLWEQIKDEYESVEEFLNTYIYDTTEPLNETAKSHKILISEKDGGIL